MLIKAVYCSFLSCSHGLISRTDFCPTQREFLLFIESWWSSDEIERGPSEHTKTADFCLFEGKANLEVSVIITDLTFSFQDI